MVSGLLNPKMGGPERISGTARRAWRLRAAAGSSPQPEERNRRSVYIFVRRNARYPMLEAFDMPDTHESCSRRDVTTTAPQALTMLNDRVALQWARGVCGARAGRRRIRWTRLPAGLFARRPMLGEGRDRHVLPQAEVRDRRARRPRRETGAAALRCRRAAWSRHTPRHSWISARCCSTPTNSSIGIKP